MSHFVSTIWKNKLAFESHINDHIIFIDSNGEDSDHIGPNPKPLMLSSLAGCSGMDVMSLLPKMRVSVSSFRMDIQAELTTEHPKIYSHIHLDYFFEGENPKVDKILKAVRLSQERYCGVSEMIRRVCPLTYSVYVNGKLVLEKEISKREEKS
ncbi:MAG TPA: OsmC family peroxiredoxin [Bacteroidetes bacterium]|nr:OsmC family peroxiredoxin [Bacteroidota bacterium]